MYDFSNQVVIVTGAVGNLGSAIARAFQAGGAKLVLVDRAADRLREAFPDLVDAPNHFLANCADLTNRDDVEAAIMGACSQFRHIDVLVNAVGGYRAGAPLHETPLETWDMMLDLNARSVFVASQVVIPRMLEHGRGKIINVAARAALSGGSNMSAYSASKSAVVRLTESMAAELKEAGLNVNCILPGTIDTPQNREAMPNADYGHWVEPDSLADVILFLASNAARDIHGAAVPVYGRS